MSHTSFIQSPGLKDCSQRRFSSFSTTIQAVSMARDNQLVYTIEFYPMSFLQTPRITGFILPSAARGILDNNIYIQLKPKALKIYTPYGPAKKKAVSNRAD
jgi:hypothetical protein